MTFSKRFRFVAVLTGLGTIYGGVLAFRLLGHQADALSDVVKLSLLIFLALLPLSTFWWTIITPKIKGPIGGALAALITGICVIPVPTFIGGFKSHYVEHRAVFTGAIEALKFSVSTLSLAEFIALPLCAIAGYWLAK
ncbi:hypothetical protein [Hellea balneolensis]|uniref:hypothetical protein n=1 Tax=Hellea balneolensis TaxID=287478 RepID=UPI000417B1F7|nr:hypothetical protein [Hellea balneolensis]